MKKINIGKVDPNLDAGVLGGYFADIVTGPDKQDVACLIVAPKGYGKSYSALELCWGTAIEISERIGGTPYDYFPYDAENNWLPNCATIVTEDIVDILHKTKKHNVYLLDDIGVGWNARKFRDAGNILLNDIFELIRIDNTVLIMTVMDQEFIDKVPRSIVPYFCEINRKMHKYGVNELKVFTNRKLYRVGKINYPHIAINRDKYIRYYCEMPPKWMWKAYDHMRATKTVEDRNRKVESFKTGDKTTGKREQQWQEKKELFGQQIVDMTKDGLTETEISRRLGLDRGTVRRLKGKLNMSY